MSERFLLVPFDQLVGADDPALLSAADLDRRVTAWAQGLPAWPVVIELRHPWQSADCLFNEVETSAGIVCRVARYGLIGRTRKGGKFGKAGLGFCARKAGTTVNGATHHALYSEALAAAY